MFPVPRAMTPALCPLTFLAVGRSAVGSCLERASRTLCLSRSHPQSAGLVSGEYSARHLRPHAPRRYRPHSWGIGEHDERQAKARRIAIEWPYTAAQVLQVVNAADGDETIARKALTSTAQIGYGDHLTNAARAAWSMRKASAGS